MEHFEGASAPPSAVDRAGEFTILPAADGGQIPESVARELRELSDAVKSVSAATEDAVVGTRFGRRIIVAPVDNPGEAVDIADVDIPRAMILTIGAKNPGPAGALLAQIMLVRTEMVCGYATAPDTEGPVMSELQRLLPALRGEGACRVDELGTVALGRRPVEVAGALEALEASQDADAEEDA